MQIVEEPRAAHVGKSVDLPVLPPSGELTRMEIDLVEDDVHSSAGILYMHMIMFMISCAFLKIKTVYFFWLQR